MGGKKPGDKNREWEKGRRDKLNQSFSELSKLLPDHDPSITLSKMEILNRAANYIRTLQQQNQDILSDGKETFLDEEVNKLQKRVAHLIFKTKLLVDALRNAGVPIPEVKTPKTRNRKKQNPKTTGPSPLLQTSKNCDGTGERINLSQQNNGSDNLSESFKTPLEVAWNISSKDSTTVEILEEPFNKSIGENITVKSVTEKDVVDQTTELSKELSKDKDSRNSVSTTVSISQTEQTTLINNVKDGPLISSIPGVLTSVQSTPLPNFTLLDRSLVNLGAGTLILADGRVVNVAPPLQQIVVKPQPTLILMQKTVRKEKRLYPKQLDGTKTTFSNKTPIPGIKQFNFEFKTKRSRIKVTKTRISPKINNKKKEVVRTKVGTKLQSNKDSKIKVGETSKCKNISNTNTKNIKKSKAEVTTLSTLTPVVPGKLSHKDSRETSTNDSSLGQLHTSVSNKQGLNENTALCKSEELSQCLNATKQSDQEDMGVVKERSFLQDMNVLNNKSIECSDKCNKLLESEVISNDKPMVTETYLNSSSSDDVNEVSKVQDVGTDEENFKSLTNVNSEKGTANNGMQTVSTDEFSQSKKIAVDNCESYGDLLTSSNENEKLVAVDVVNDRNSVKFYEGSSDLNQHHLTKEASINYQSMLNNANLEDNVQPSNGGCTLVKDSVELAESSEPDSYTKQSTLCKQSSEVLQNVNRALSEQSTVSGGETFNSQNNLTSDPTVLSVSVNIEDKNEEDPKKPDESANNIPEVTSNCNVDDFRSNDYFTNRMQDVNNKSGNVYTNLSGPVNVESYIEQGSLNNSKNYNTHNREVPGYNYSEEKSFSGNTCLMNQDSYRNRTHCVTSVDQAITNETFVNCRMVGNENVSNCNLIDQNKSHCKEMFGNSSNNSVKNSYLEQGVCPSTSQCGKGNRKYSFSDNSEPVNNRTSIVNKNYHHYEMVNNSPYCVGQNGNLYNKDFVNQCSSINKDYYRRQDSLNKSSYSSQNIGDTLTQNIFSDQIDRGKKTRVDSENNTGKAVSHFPSSNPSLNRNRYSNTRGNEETFSELNKKSFVSKESYTGNSSKDVYSDGKDAFAYPTRNTARDETFVNKGFMTLSNKESYGSINKDTYSDVVNKDNYSSRNNDNYNNTQREESFTNMNKAKFLPSKDSYGKTNKDSYSGVENGSIVLRQTSSVGNTESSFNNEAIPQNASASLNKQTRESNSCTTADKACQPEVSLCRNISGPNYLNANMNSRNPAQNNQLPLSNLKGIPNKNCAEISERHVNCQGNNANYSTDRSGTFSRVSRHNKNTLFNADNQKTNKDNIFEGKNNTAIVCNYTIDSLFKNGSLNAAQVSIGSNTDKAPDSNSTPSKNIDKRNDSFEVDGLTIVNDNLTQSQSQMYHESNQYGMGLREANQCGNNIHDNNIRNDINMSHSSCDIVQTNNSNNTCKNNSSSGRNKNEDNGKMYSNTTCESNMVSSNNELIKSKEIDRNNFMPLLDDVRLTTDFSSDLFSSFQVTPGGQHPESMSPTAAFLLAFPLVSSSKTTDNINDNDNPEHNSATPTTILQIGNIDQPNADMFSPQIDTLRNKSVEESNKDYERFANYDPSLYDSIQVDNSKRKQSQTLSDQNCLDKNYRRNNCDSRKRPRNQSDQMPSYSQSYSYPIFTNNNDFSQFTNVNDPKSDLSAPWSMPLNQEFPTQAPVSKDICPSTKSVKTGDRKNSKADKQQLKTFSCSQQGSQTVQYYAPKNERKKQKTSHPKTPVNWMAPSEPPKNNNFIEPSMSHQIEVYSKEMENNIIGNQNQNIYNNMVSSLEVPFDSVCFSDFGGKKSNNYSWSPSKSLLPSLDSHNFVIPSTLPTLVGDLALGTSTPAFDESRKCDQPKKADKSSSTYLDNATNTTKKRLEYVNKNQANNSFLSVSQLVDPKSQKQNKMNEIKSKRSENSSKDKYQHCQNVNSTRQDQEQTCLYNQREVQSCWNEKQKNHYKGGNYSAESLIGQPSDNPESFHLFNNYQAQSNYLHGDFSENNQMQQSQQYQNYFNSQNSHFHSFIGEEYPEFSGSSVGNQRKRKSKESGVYSATTHSKPQESFVPLHKDTPSYLQKEGGYHTPSLLTQGYPNCIKSSVPYGSQQSNTTSTLTNFNLSTIFPEMNDQRVSGSTSQASHVNPNFSSLALHNYPPQ